MPTLRPSRRATRGSQDLVKKVLLLCLCIIVSLTVNTLPHLQKVLDRLQDGNSPMLDAMESFPIALEISSSSRRDRFVTLERNRGTSCLVHDPIEARFDHVKEYNQSEKVLQQPTTACGKLRRKNYWTGPRRRSAPSAVLPFMSDLAAEILQHQSDCSLPMATFHVDNDFGLGSHLVLWSQALCNAWEQGYRLRTVNPEWLWLDQTYCPRKQAKLSPLLCYFPETEFRCPADQDRVRRELAVNVTDPRDRKTFCKRIRENINDNRTLPMFRAASFEYIFQRVSNIVIQEAERQIGLLFDGNEVPDNLITVHVRWGDKFWEMNLPPMKEYIDAVDRIVKARRSPKKEPVHIYLATEDPKAAREFLQLKPKRWIVHLDRTVAEMNAYRPHRGNRASWTTRNTQGRAGLVALGSLLVALEADAFVLTTQSNWSRLMDALRRNVIDRRCGNCTSMIDLRPGEW